MQNAPSTSGSSGAPVSNQTSPISSQASLPTTDSDDTIILPHSDNELRSRAWPREFPIPHFPYNVEVQLQRGNDSFRETGTQLKITPGLKSDILEKLAEEIFQYTAYPQNYQIDEVAEALIKKFPCLKEPSATGYYGWMISLKYKMANYRTKMRTIGFPEVTVNALKNKHSDDCLPAKNVKKPKKAEVNFCPSHPAGETDESLENVRLEMLNDVRQRNGASCVKKKMSKTFSYRRKEVVQENPAAGEFKARWLALFHIDEINAEFHRITTVPLETTFMAQLDSLLPQLTSIFNKKGGVSGQKLAKHLAILQEDIEGDDIQRDLQNSTMGVYVINKEGGEIGAHDDIGIYVEGEIILDNIGSVAQACAMMLGVIYVLNMAYPKELKYSYEFIQKDIEGDDIQRDLQNSTMGVYVINKEGGEIGAHDDIGIYVEGEIILDNIGSVAQACAMMLGVIYVLNMAYPKELKYSYEFIQKVLLKMDGERLSPKVLGLKNKIIAGL
ncbi:sterile alpha motif domain-containing 3-like protein [Labeo rohita]|uniref:Sterile alpha motif domain-containing 3-like protein n=1 Tax=Labeo rohita TaxID=84645 RepID=A0A498P425_LABRO|nr:sterile alpha motif domain-containing 3-like protein [Labeo rohita]